MGGKSTPHVVQNHPWRVSIRKCLPTPSTALIEMSGGTVAPVSTAHWRPQLLSGGEARSTVEFVKYVSVPSKSSCPMDDPFIFSV